MKAVGFCVLLLLFSMVAGGVSAAPGTRGQPSSQTLAATSRAPMAWLYIPASHMPSAGDAVGGAPVDPPKPNSTPMPAPAATNHYAGSVE